MRGTWLLLLMLAFACTEEPATPETPAPEPEVTAEIVPEEESDDELLDETESEEGPSHAYDEAELDRMSEEELEAACFQGAHAACDRLGH